MVLSVTAYNAESMNYLYGMGTEGSMQLVPGTYDFCLRYTNFTQDKSYYVVRENVKVEEGVSLSFDPSEASNRISFAALDENGDRLSIPEYEYVLDDQGNWVTELVKDGNCQGVGFMSGLFLKDVGLITSTYLGASEGCYYSFDEASSININDLSGRYTVIYNMLFTKKDAEFYLLDGQLSGCDGNVELKNAPATYNTTSQKYVLNVPAGMDSPRVSLCNLYQYVDGEYYNGWEGGAAMMSSASDVTVKYHQAGKVSVGDGSITENTLFSTGLAYLNIGEDDYTKIDGILSSPTAFTDGKMQMHFSCNGIYEQNMKDAASVAGLGNVDSYSGLAPFSYTWDDTSLIPGSSAPMLCFKVQNCVSWTQFPFFPWNLEYRGILGELRSCDLDLLKPTVKYGGVLQNVTNYDELYNFPGAISQSGETELKKLEVELSVNNHDGEGRQISNDARIMMDLSKEDYVPPTLRMLQLRDGSGKIATIFDDEVEIDITALVGDFNFDMTKGTILSGPVTAEFHYALSGTSDWKSIDMQVEDEYSSANFGYFYRGSVENPAIGSYDIRILLTDASGNTQEQVIGNAFTVKDLSGVESIGEDVEKNQRIYDLFGCRVDNPQSGSVYIVNGRKVIWK